MSAPLQFETPENVQIEHRLAGPGTRYLAWFIDGIIVNVLSIVLILALIWLGFISSGLFDGAEKKAEDMFRKDPERMVAYFMGIAMLIFGLGSFFYYGLSELLWRGQTLGKSLCQIRVVKLNGFSLDAVSIFVRSIFRVADHLPPLCFVPMLSKYRQRFGDMVAGTIVISSEAEDLTEIREQLSNRNAAEAKFTFDYAKLARLIPSDFDAIEQVLDRWDELSETQQERLLNRMVGPLCKKMQREEPGDAERLIFLEDLLAAEFRRQDRHLH